MKRPLDVMKTDFDEYIAKKVQSGEISRLDTCEWLVIEYFADFLEKYYEEHNVLERKK